MDEMDEESLTVAINSLIADFSNTDDVIALSESRTKSFPTLFMANFVQSLKDRSWSISTDPTCATPQDLLWQMLEKKRKKWNKKANKKVRKAAAAAAAAAAAEAEPAAAAEPEPAAAAEPEPADLHLKLHNKLDTMRNFRTAKKGSERFFDAEFQRVVPSVRNTGNGI